MIPTTTTVSVGVTPIHEIPGATPQLTEGIGTPLWWVYRLADRLNRETTGYIEHRPDGILIWREGMAKLQRYYEGHHDLPWVRDDDVAAEYQTMLARARSNFMGLVVDVAAERLTVMGLRLPGDDEVADTETWDIWQRNDLDRWFPAASRLALTQRRCTWLVWPDQVTKQAKITLEDPQQTIVEYVSGDPSTIAAGLKLWVDDWTGMKRANLFLPDVVIKFSWRKAASTAPEGWYEIGRERNPFGRVPMFPMVHKPGLHGSGSSRIEDVIPHQDRINQTILGKQVAEHLSAFAQKWATGLEIPIDDETGDPIEVYKTAIDKLWISPDPQSRFGQFEATNVANYLESIEGEVQHISILTRTPRHVFQVQGQAPSGDAMKSDEAGLVADVTGTMQPSFGSTTRQMLAFARQVEGKSTEIGTEIVWGDPEWQTFGELVDGTIKLVQTGIGSKRWAREKIGMSPATIRRVESEVMEDILLDAALAPEPTNGGGDAAGSSAPPAG